jgi:hypothetical protein
MLFNEDEFIEACILCKDIYESYIGLKTLRNIPKYKQDKNYYATKLRNDLDEYSDTLPKNIRDKIGIDVDKLEKIIELNLKK